MASNIIGDAKFQQLNMSFTFDQQSQAKLIIQALVENVPYTIELAANPYLDFEDLKNVLITKQFKLISKTSQLLKLKIGATNLQFANVQKMTLKSLQQTVLELKNDLKDQCHKNILLQDSVKKIRIQLDLMTTKMSDVLQNNDQLKEQLSKLRKQYGNLSQKQSQNNLRMTLYQEKILNNQKVTDELKQEVAQSKIHIQSHESKLRNQQQKLNYQQIILQKQQLFFESQNNKKIIKQTKKQQSKPLNNAQNQTKPDTKYRFSETQKSKSITFTNNFSKAISCSQDFMVGRAEYLALPQSGKGSGINFMVGIYQFALVHGKVLKSGSSIRFKIQENSNCITVGLGIRNLIKAYAYKLQKYDKLGHGCFVLMWNGRLYSHSIKENNNQIKGIEFDSGDVIRVTTNAQQLIFVNETKNNKQYRMKIRLTEEEWEQASFCVSIGGKADSVSIL